LWADSVGRARYHASLNLLRLLSRQSAPQERLVPITRSRCVGAGILAARLTVPPASQGRTRSGTPPASCQIHCKALPMAEGAGPRIWTGGSIGVQTLFKRHYPVK